MPENKWYHSFILWLGDFVEDGTTGKPSVKRYGVALGATVLAVVMSYLGYVIGQAVIDSAGEDRVKAAQIAKDALSDVVMWFSLLVTGNYAGGKLIERIGGPAKKEGDQ